MNNNPIYLRILYIVLVPVVLVMIILHSGLIQKTVTATTVAGEKYSVVAYNFYYFDYYNSFLAENEDNLDELGYDTSVADTEQNYDSTTTWREYFLEQAEAEMAEVAYYYDLAEAAGYEFSEEELSAIDTQLEANEEEMNTIGLNAKNYYISYYGTGMTEARYTEELTKKVKAMAYKAYLSSTYEVTDEEVVAWESTNASGDAQAVNLSVITLDALADRETGEIGESQIRALQSKLEALLARYESGVQFSTLQSAFSTCEFGDASGDVSDAVASDTPEVLQEDCFGNQDAMQVGDVYAEIDEDAGIAYVAVFEGFGTDATQVEAREALIQEKMEAELQEALSGDYQVVRKGFGMRLVAS